MSGALIPTLFLVAACSTTLDPTLAPADSGDSGAATGCTALETTGKRYLVCASPPVPFSAASEGCAELGGELASVRSAQENALLAAGAAAVETTSNLWIGGSRDDQHVWTWEDGTAFWNGLADGQPAPNAFANWKAGEPNDASTVSDDPERCAVLTLFDTQWNDRVCSLELSYYCEMPRP